MTKASCLILGLREVDIQQQDADRARRVVDNAVSSGDGIRPGLPVLPQLPHRTVHLPVSDGGIDLGPVTLGDRIGGDGHYGLLYKRPDLALKLIHRENSGRTACAPSVSSSARRYERHCSAP